MGKITSVLSLVSSEHVQSGLEPTRMDTAVLATWEDFNKTSIHIQPESLKEDLAVNMQLFCE